MSTSTRPGAQQEIEYPETDSEPIAENTQQYNWITKIKWNVQRIFRDDEHVFVAADLIWYLVEGDNKTRRAPDLMVALGRPKGPRSAYLQWLEAGIAPQVVFEILSPSNRGPELARKFRFYEAFGVEEYYIYDPDDNSLEGWLRGDGSLTKISTMNGWISPRLGVRFLQADDDFLLFRPDGELFISDMERDRQAEEQAQRADEQERRVERLSAQLKALGIEPEL